MSDVLLDTHALVWLVSAPDRLGRSALRLANVAQDSGGLYVSAISFWEVAMLDQRGSLRLKAGPGRWRSDVLRLGVREAPVDGAIAIRSTELMSAHRDPADRMIVATALGLGATLVTADEALLGWSGKLKRHDARR